MPTDHEEPCGSSHRSFCLNGGICYVIPTIRSPFCRCIENYTGARCEEVFLPSSSIQTKSDLFATFVALTILLGTLIIGALYFLCRKGHLQRTSSVQYDINLVEMSSGSAHHDSDPFPTDENQVIYPKFAASYQEDLKSSVSIKLNLWWC